MQVRTPAGEIVDVIYIGDPATGLPSGGGASGGAAVSQTFYEVTTAFTGGDIGDLIRLTQYTDITATPPEILSESWYNLTQGAVLATAPDSADLAVVSQSGLTDAQLRASPVGVVDAPAVAKLEELRVQLMTLLGNTDGIEALATQTNALLTATQAYVDEIEGLLTTLNTSTDGLESLLTQIGLNTDEIETFLQAIRDRLPAALGKQAAAASLSVTLATGETLPLPAGAATEATLAAAAGRLPTALGPQTRAGSLSTLSADDPFTITGRTRDPARDVVYNYADGTAQTLFYTTAGEFAGIGARA